MKPLAFGLGFGAGFVLCSLAIAEVLNLSFRQWR
jgi:hypothetical protein